MELITHAAYRSTPDDVEKLRVAGWKEGEISEAVYITALDEKAVDSFFTNLGAFDHLVFTAGDSLQLHELADTDLKQARRAFELRYWSALATVKYGSPQIRKAALSFSRPESRAGVRTVDG